MNVMIIGGGGREHALAWKLRKSRRVDGLFCAPGNAGTALIARNLEITDHGELARFARDNGVGMTVVGPDNALAAGIVDVFQEAGLRVFGPTQKAARFEWSKIFAKEFMGRHGISTAKSGHFTESADAQLFSRGMRLPVVIKADGLALGKGVVIAESSDAAAKAIYQMMERGQFGEAGKGLVVEEFLRGRECSLHAILDSKSYLLLPGAQDHKQVFDGGRGPNTGGMGSFSPSGLLTPEMEARVRREIMEPFMAGLREEGIDYRGTLYPGLMMTAEGPKVLEFNSRFGDPETQCLLPRLKSDLLDILEASVDGTLSDCHPEWSDEAAVCVVMTSGGYPGAYATGTRISGLEDVDPEIMVFHAGTSTREGQTVTSGGRVLGVTALGATLAQARERVYEAISRIGFEGAHFRRDIGVGA